MRPELSRLTTALLTIAFIALAAPSWVSAAESPPPGGARQALEGKTPMCSGASSVVLGLPATVQTADGPVVTGPDLQVRNGVYVSGGLAYILTWFDGPGPCPGPPSEIKVLSVTEATTCGAMELLTIEVVDASGYNVSDGTPLSLATNLGSIQDSITTKDGIAYASFRAPTSDAGTAEITVRAGAVIAFKTLAVTCAQDSSGAL